MQGNCRCIILIDVIMAICSIEMAHYSLNYFRTSDSQPPQNLQHAVFSAILV